MTSPDNHLGAATLMRAVGLLVLAIGSTALPSALWGQPTTLRVGTNSPASAESVLFSIAS